MNSEPVTVWRPLARRAGFYASTRSCPQGQGEARWYHESAALSSLSGSNTGRAGAFFVAMPKGKEELPGNLDDIEAEAILGGSVAEFQDGSFQVVPMEADAETVKLAANGMESTLESTTVSYGEDCTFHIANINSATGAVEFEAATSSDVKKSTSVYIYGETQDDGTIYATKVLLPRYK